MAIGPMYACFDIQDRKEARIVGKQVMFRAAPDVAGKLYMKAGKNGVYGRYVKRGGISMPGDNDIPIPCEPGTKPKAAYQVGCALAGWRGLHKAAKGIYIRVDRSKVPEARLKIRPNYKYYDQHLSLIHI